MIGTVKRLDEMFYLILPEDAGVNEIVVQNGAFVMFGDVLAISPEYGIVDEKSLDTLRVRAPLDGYICLRDGEGNLLRNKGDTLNRGDVAAVLEFMKIRMDIEFEGPSGCEFCGYLCSDHAAVRRGDPIFEYLIKK